MTTLTCTECREPVNYGEAVMRSRLFEQVAFHRECFDRIRVDVPVIPEQRQPEHDNLIRA